MLLWGDFRKESAHRTLSMFFSLCQCAKSSFISFQIISFSHGLQLKHISLLLSAFLSLHPLNKHFPLISLLSKVLFTASLPFVNLPILPTLIRSHHTCSLSFLSSLIHTSFSIYALIHFALQTCYSKGVAHYLESILTFGVHSIIFVMFLCVFNAFLQLLLPGEEQC